MLAPTAEPTSGQQWAATFGAIFLRALFFSLRVRIHDPSGHLASPPPTPVIYAFWHNRILAVTSAFLRVYPTMKRHGVLVLTSASRDGMWLGELVRRLGMGAVRGSSSRRGATAMREMLAKVSEGYDIAITPDGPRGPKYHLNPGMVYLAQTAHMPIITIHAKFCRAIRLRSWDNFTIPLPFSRVDVTLGPILSIPQTDNEESFEAERQKIESVLRSQAD